ncbi:MAG: caspase family protein [Ignavibacteriae bacterium]|nr:caspase family protein [Ignavibacteriota bacterium]
MKTLIILLTLIVVLTEFSESQTARGEGKPGPLIQPIVDVDNSIPKGKLPEEDNFSRDAVAVVIGISHYKNEPTVPSVDYATRDANVMKRYLIEMFGYQEQRIIVAEDANASLADFKRIFEEQLVNFVHTKRSDVFVYYSGHGAPDVETKDAYFVPYDCNPNYAKSTGYRLKEFYERLARLDARSVTVVIDACFSGGSERGSIIKDVSPVGIEVENPVAALENGIVFTASKSQQLSNWYREKRHGLFTYFFLRGLRGDADSNKDKEITAEEMEGYLIAHVPEVARSRNREQIPEVAGNKKRVLVKF